VVYRQIVRTDSQVRNEVMRRIYSYHGLEEHCKPRARGVGPLEGVSGDAWQALALALCYHDAPEDWKFIERFEKN
jgi:hypothetical protein